jgi:predicted enzyme related to lactoylglutathione lyase
MDDLTIAYVNVFVTDLARSLAFYEQVLGMTVLFRHEQFGYASIAAGPIHMGLAQIDPKDEHVHAMVGRHTGVGFATRDLVAAHARLAARGVAFPMKPEKQPWGGFMALLADPDGNVFYLDQIRDH